MASSRQQPKSREPSIQHGYPHSATLRSLRPDTPCAFEGHTARQAYPWVIGDNYDEAMESLSRLAEHGLALHIAKPMSGK